MQLWTAFLLGFVGSLHCAGMCGPLVLLTPHVGRGRAGFVVSRLAYHAGRLTVYAAIGAGMGLAGHTFTIAGLQRWVALAAGLALLLGLLLAHKWKLNAPAWRIVVWLKTTFAVLSSGERTLRSSSSARSMGFSPAGSSTPPRPELPRLQPRSEVFNS